MDNNQKPSNSKTHPNSQHPPYSAYFTSPPSNVPFVSYPPNFPNFVPPQFYHNPNEYWTENVQPWSVDPALLRPDEMIMILKLYLLRITTLIPAPLENLLGLTKTTLLFGKPGWNSLSGSDPQIPFFLENGPYVPTQTVHAFPAANGQPAIPARELVKPVTDWNEEDRRLVNIDTKARSLIAMSLPDDIFHSVCHLRSAKEIWNTLCVQYEGMAVLMESRKIFLVRQYESFIHQKDETLSQIHQRFNCLLIDLKTIGTIYPNSEKKLKKNLIRDTKDSKSTSLALVSDSVPVAAPSSSSVTITEVETSDSDMSEDFDFNESLALLTRSFKKESVNKATATCYNCQGKGHFANDCRYKKNQFAPSSTKSSSKTPKYLRLKEKYKKMKSQRKGKGLIAEDCDWDDVSSDESSDEEDTTPVALMAIIEEPTLALMAKIEEVPEEAPTQAPEASTSATESTSQVPTPVVPLESITQLDLLTLDLYKALNGKTSAQKMNIDLRDQLKECHEKLKHLTILEENYKDQVSVNQTLYIERERALAAKERALAELNAEKVTIKGWSNASEKVDEILALGRNINNKKGLGFTSGCPRPDRSMLKFEMFVSSIPDPNASENIPSSSNTHTEGAPKSKKKTVEEKSKTVLPSKTKTTKPKNSKVLGGGPSVSGTKSFSQNPAPRLKIDLKQKTKEKKPIPPLSNAKGVLGTGPAHLKFKDFLDPTKHFLYRKCYHCGLNDHIASKCPDATKAEKSARVKKNPKTGNSVKGKKVVKTVPSVKTPARKTVKTDKGIWYLDSGCSRHMTGSKSVLSDYRDERGPTVTFGGNGKGQTRGYGTLTNGVTTFKRVAYVEGLMHITKLAVDGEPVSDPTLYRSLAGALQNLTFTRPDIAYAVQQVCLFMHDPRLPHLNALKRILRYLKGTLSHGLHIKASAVDRLVAYSDTDWAGCPNTCRSTSGFCVYLGDNLVSWSSKRQHVVSRSSAEAKYRGIANVVAEAAWLRNLLLELSCPLSRVTVVFCDNVSAMYLASNLVQHQRTKHVEIDLHFVRERVAIGHVRVLHVPSAYQYADIFTKGLPSSLFLDFRDSLNIRVPPDQTTGVC
ncbi:hypothetical protein OSB04_021375 [Centaurea solstitialis]|uniref:CCHC-type domain-containing protein n=1 Tax=Centaurea solstitialis TaxID=347529 RepID=A0AA38TCG1_9ASTR|nr:hypothetical protein OSB04_021375 [Centaurea solstitialis]